MRHLDLTGMLPGGAPLVTRFAPSPTGYLHLGHVVNALYVWGIARALGARVILRIEDHDRIRCRQEYEDAVLEDLDWLGFVPDEGRHPVLRQRDRAHVYETALATLATTAHVYRCDCSRRDIGAGPYPGTCRSRAATAGDTSGLRVEMTPGSEAFDDLLLGRQQQSPAAQCGDLLVLDRDGHWTYQFAVTVDDLTQGVNLVIRGADLLDSTGRQLRLARLLGRTAMPVFAHHPLIVNHRGEKLSKSDGVTGIRELRRAGMTADRVLGRAAALAGLTDREEELDATAVSRFWDRI
ncbi:MAG: glutamate--tRNA ligase family protein [Vicinamibacterales bacterium]